MPRPRSVNPSRTSAVTLGLCFTIALLEGFDLQAAGVAAPRLAPAFAMTASQLGWFFSSSTFGLMLGATAGGRLSDHFGRKRVLIISVAVFGLMSTLTALATSIDMLMAARFLTGAGLGGALPNLIALSNENAGPKQKNLAVGLLYAGLPLGGALASLLVALGRADNWQTIFHIGGLAPLLTVPLLMIAMPESRQLTEAASGRMSQSMPGSGFNYGLLQEGRASRTALLWIAFFLALLTMYLLLNWLPTLLIERGLSRPQASLVQVSFNVFGGIASMATGALLDRTPRAYMALLTFGLAAISLLVLAGAPADFALSLMVGGFTGFAVSATQAFLYATAPLNYPTRARGTGVGAAVSMGRLGSAVGPLLAASLLGAGRGAQEVLSVLIPAMLLAGAAALVLAVIMKRENLGASEV